nr:hypothetical protein PFCWREHM_PFCWREHM_CDS_0008 [Microvirus sp.]
MRKIIEDLLNGCLIYFIVVLGFILYLLVFKH